MDFLDPKKNLQHSIILMTGYLLIAVAVVLGTIVLLYSAYGYGFGKNGTIIQNGFLYLSSQPNPANIYLNGRLNASTTNARLLLQEGIYNVSLTRTGYRSWTRTIELNGGTVESFTYPLLIPQKIETSVYKSYSGSLQLATQSPNQKFLVVLQPGENSQFDVYDLTNPTAPPTVATMPDGVATTKVSTDSWQVVAWSSDNQHVLLDHTYDSNNEYILLDVANPDQSLNLSKVFSDFSFSSIAFNNEKYDQYYLYDDQGKTLTSVSLSNPTVANSTLDDVDAYSSYGNSTILYATSKDAPANKENVDILEDGQVYKVTDLPANTTYLLDMAGYNGTIYVAAGSASGNKTYVYSDPVGQIKANPKIPLAPSWVLFVKNPNYLSFSNNAQFIVAEGGQQFGVYDIENNHGYNYTSNYPLDSPQTHASWVDGDRMTYVSGGKELIFEYDDNYPQLLMPTDSSFLPFVTANYKYVYVIADTTSGEDITKTSL